MALIAYVRQNGAVIYAFRGEEHRLPDEPLEALPPNPTTVHSTNTYMSEPQLDSISTIYELDRILNIEAREEKELLVFNEYRKNI